MAVAPQFVTHRLGPATASHVLELYVDYVCPFSKKQVLGVRDVLFPLLRENKAEGNLSVVLRQTPQPWHASSTLVHEAGIAASHLSLAGAPSAQAASDKFWKFSYALFEVSDQFYDEPVENETTAQTRSRLADLAGSVGFDRSEFLDQLKIGKGNSGNKTGTDLKLQVKLGRQNGIHVTPTAVLDGLVDPSISSSFGREEWGKWLREKGIVGGKDE